MARSNDDAPPMTGKVKGGPSKRPDAKPTKMAKVAAPKSEGKSPGGKAGFKMSKGGAAKKISAPKTKNYVRPQIRTEKAKAEFTLPKPSMPKKSARSRKR